jgi:hypothetical protein
MEVTDAAARYEATLRKHADLTRNLAKSNVEAGNRLVHDAQELYLRLRDTPEGRQVIERLAQDPDRLVRLTAAAHCLKWNPGVGKSALQEIRDGGGQDGPGWDIAGFNAKWTLKTFEDGTFNPDWRPKRGMH